jgi:hypothetical protein
VSELSDVVRSEGLSEETRRMITIMRIEKEASRRKEKEKEK